MNMPEKPLAPETEAALLVNGGPLKVDGQRGEYVVMTLHVYDAMLGISPDEEAETLASVRRGVTDAAAGRVRDASAVFDELEKRHAA